MMRIRPGRPNPIAPIETPRRPRIHKTLVVMVILGALYGWVAPQLATTSATTAAHTAQAR